MTQYIETQEVVAIAREELPARAAQLAKDGWRIVHVACINQGDHLDIIYAFDKAYKLVNYKVTLAKDDAVVPSITASYLAAFAYENELQDLFAVKVTDLALDFKGKFYRKRHEAPFNPPACAAAAAPAPTEGKA